MVGDDAVVDAEGGEDFLGTADFAGFVREAEQIQVFAAFGFTDQFEQDLSVFVAGDAPIGVVVADDAGEIDLEGGWEFEVEDDFVIVVEFETDEAFFDI